MAPNPDSPRRAGTAAIGMTLAEVPTPALVVDLDRLEANMRRWQAEMASSQVAFRPHVKTHKTPELALRQLDLGAVGIAVSQISEAEVFADAGVRDIVIAYPLMTPDAWERAAALAVSGLVLSVNIDSERGACGLGEAAASVGTRIGVQLDIDTGLGRSGHSDLAVDDLVALARVVRTHPGLVLEGVTTHRGAHFPAAGAMTPAEAGHDEGTRLVALAARLRERGLALEHTTAGSTPTGRALAGVSGVTEVRAGTYVFNDLTQVALGSADEPDLALTVLCTVVSKSGTRATIDGGSKAFAADTSLPSSAERPAGVARALDRVATVERVWEEHGVIGEGAATLELGEKVRWVPSHVCTCVNLADELVGVREGRVEAVWRIAARGRRTPVWRQGPP